MSFNSIRENKIRDFRIKSILYLESVVVNLAPCKISIF